MKKAALVLAVLGAVLLWLGSRGGGPPEPRAPEGGESGRMPSTNAAAQQPIDQSLRGEPVSARQAASRRAAASPPAGRAALRVVLESDFEPLTHVAVQVVEPESGTVAGAPQETYEGASWKELAPGSYRVQAWADGWEPAAQDVRLAAGAAETEARLRMHPLNWFAGDVVDRHDGRVVEEFRVEVELRSPADGIGVWPARALQVRSKDGRFALGGAPSTAEVVRFVVSAAGYLAETTDWLSARAHVEDLVVELAREGVGESFVSARAVHATGAPAPRTRMILVAPHATMDSVRLSDGDPTVYASADVTGEVAHGGARAETDDEGRARVTTRYEGPARLLVVPRDGRAFLTEPFELSHRRETDLGELRIEPGGGITGHVWIGDLPANAAVRSVAVTREPGATISVRLDEDGEFRIAGLEAGFYRVSAMGEISGPDGASTAILPFATIGVRVEDLETEHVELHCGSGLLGATVQGRVERVEELDEIRVVVLDIDLSPVRLGFAGDDGSFRLTDLPDGEYTLAVTGRSEDMDHFAAAWQPLSLPSAALAPLDVRLRHSRVELLAPDAPGGWFDATARTGNPLFDELVGVAVRGTLDANGHAVVQGLPAGVYRFRTPRGEREIAIPAEGGTFPIDM